MSGRIFAVACTIAVASTSGVLSGQDAHSQTLKRPNMISLPPRLQPLFASTRTVCFGRFVIDVPTTATVVYGPAEVEARIARYPNEAKRIPNRLAQLLTEIEADREFLEDDDLKRMPLFGKVIAGEVLGQKLIFGSRDHATYSIHSLIPIGTDLFVHYVDSGLPSESEIARLVGNFNRVATSLTLRDASEIPSDSGVCIDGGFLPLNLKRERVTLGISFKEFPDVNFSISAHKNLDRLRESSDLEGLFKKGRQRAQQEGQGALHAQIRSLRQGRRQMRDWNGFELLLRMPVYEGHTAAHEFRFHSLGAIDDALRPQLDVQLDTGVENNRKAAVRPSLIDEEAIALWETLISSIRVRQASDGKKVTSGQARSPLGLLAPSGSACVETGWWQCNENGSLGGDGQRHFILGELLPNAAFLTNASIWQMLRGEKPQCEKATIWRLVAYDSSSSVTERE